MKPSEAVALPGTFNARAFTSVQTGRFWLVRSAALDALSDEGVQRLHGLGVTRVVDLRRPGEGGRAAHDVEVSAIPLYDPGAPVPVTGRLEDILEGVLVTRGVQLARAVEVISSASEDGAVAVHCTIGKDRTGLVVALALLAAGVSPSVVIDDYVLSHAEVVPHRRAFVRDALRSLDLSDEERAEAWRLNLESPPEVLSHVIALLDAAGGAAAYLVAHGLSERSLSLLRAHVGTE